MKKITNLLTLIIFIATCFLCGCAGTDGVPLGTSVNFLDTGCSECVFVYLPDGKTLLIDGGGPDSTSKVEKFLKDRSVEKIDYLLISHPDVEHLGGLENIIDKFEVGKVFHPDVKSAQLYLFPTYEQLMNKINQKGITTDATDVYDYVKGEGYFFAILSPEKEFGIYADFSGTTSPSEADVDKLSAVVYLSISGVRFLLTADAGYEVEEEIVANYRNGIYDYFYSGNTVNLEEIDFLKVSGGSSDGRCSAEFLGVIKPKNAVILTGGERPPSNFVLNRLYNCYSQYNLYRTDVCGSVYVSIADETFTVTSDARR